MFVILRKHIRSGQSIELYPLFAKTYEEAVREFTDKIREWLGMDTTGTVFHKTDPRPGWYNESEQPILYDDETLTRYEDGHNEFTISETEDETDEDFDE